MSDIGVSKNPYVFYLYFYFLYAGKSNNFPHLHKLSLVHVDDLVSAHIFLYENSNAKAGRYICSSTPTSIEEMHRLLSAKYPEFHIPVSQ